MRDGVQRDILLQIFAKQKTFCIFVLHNTNQLER